MRSGRWGWLVVLGLVACSGSPVILENVVGGDAGQQDGSADAGPSSDAGALQDSFIPPPEDASTEADGRACFVYPLATGTSGADCEPVGTGQPNPGCSDSCSPVNIGYMCTGGKPPIAGIRSGGVAYSYCSDQNACVRDSNRDALCTGDGYVDAGRVYAWACAAKPDDPNNGIAAPPHDSCQGAPSGAPGLVFDCCPFATP